MFRLQNVQPRDAALLRWVADVMRPAFVLAYQRKPRISQNGDIPYPSMCYSRELVFSDAVSGLHGKCTPDYFDGDAGLLVPGKHRFWAVRNRCNLQKLTELQHKNPWKEFRLQPATIQNSNEEAKERNFMSDFYDLHNIHTCWSFFYEFQILDNNVSKAEPGIIHAFSNFPSGELKHRIEARRDSLDSAIYLSSFYEELEELQNRHKLYSQGVGGCSSVPWDTPIPGLFAAACVDLVSELTERKFDAYTWDLRKAVYNIQLRECRSWFQPIIQLPRGTAPSISEIEVVGYEALAREAEFEIYLSDAEKPLNIETQKANQPDCDRPETPGVFPKTLFDLADKYGADFVELFDIYFLVDALKKYKENEAATGRKLSVNLAISTMFEPSRLQRLQRLLNEFNDILDSDQFAIEVNERQEIPGQPDEIQAAAEFRKLFDERFPRWRLNQDDFGVFHANIIRTAVLRPKWIKVDQFINRVPRTLPLSRRAALRSASIFAHQLGAQLVVEAFTLEPEEAVVAFEFGVHYGQGFELALPSPMPNSTLKMDVELKLMDLYENYPREVNNSDHVFIEKS